MTTELELLTVNLWGLPWPFARERHGRKRRFAQHLAVGGYDLVGIQELWRPWHRAFQARDLVLPRSRRDSGLALAARLPVRDVRVEHFRQHRGSDRLKRKGALLSTVETPPGAELSVCVVHFQAGLRFAPVRARQLDDLLRVLEPEARAVVLMGDFNFYRDSEQDRRSAARLEAAGFLDVAPALSRGENTYCATNPYVRKRSAADRFDRVYLRDARDLRLQPTSVDLVRPESRPFSDHHPLRVRVRLLA
ncbi:MAG: endonuclease/exonuclease/phosphatase family protein [Myxococcota bacterium]